MKSLIQRLVRLFEELFGGPQDARFDARQQIASSDSGVLLFETSPESELRDAQAADGPEPNAGRELAPQPSTGEEPFLLSVDDAGQFLVVLAEEIVLGHLRAGRADLLFLADVGPRHASLARTETLQEGVVWSVTPLEGELVQVNELRVEGTTKLAPGDLVRLGENLSFRILQPDPASNTILLDLLHGAECLGAKSVALFGAGIGGRIRIGSAEDRHVRVARLEHEITLVHDARRLLIHCESGVQGAESGEEGFSVPLPPPQRFDLSIGRPAGARPPFGLAIEPASPRPPASTSG